MELVVWPFGCFYHFWEAEFGEKNLFWGKVTLGCTSFPCFPQITDSSFLPLQGFFFKILILLKVNEGEHFPAHLFLLLKVQTPNTAIFFLPPLDI